MTVEGAVHANAVVVGGDFLELPVKIDRIPGEYVVQVFATDNPCHPFDQWVRRWDVGYRLDLLDFEDPLIGEASVKAKRRVGKRTWPRGGAWPALA